MFEIGRVCIKLAGRDAGMKCVVVDTVDAHTVMIDGETRRRKCNVKHLEPTSQIVSITKGASSEAVAKELGIKAREKKAAQKKSAAKPKKMHAKKTKPVKVETKKPAKAAVKKEAAKAEEKKE